MADIVAPDTGSRLDKPVTVTAMSLGFGVVQLDVIIVNTALDSIGTSFGGGVSELQWVVSIYTIAFAALILTAGALGDRFGAKRIFMAGFAVFTVASLACALAPTATILIAARAVQGAGAAILVPNSLALLNHAYPEGRERGRVVGWWLAGASVALTAGPPVGGVLIAITGWRSIFLVNLPIGLAGLWHTWRYVAEAPRTGRELDWQGQASAIGSLGMLAAALIEGGREGGRVGWSSPRVIAGFGAALILSLLFFVQERRAREPMLPLSLFAHPVFARTTFVGLLVNIPFLRIDLRLQPVLPEDQRSFAARDRCGLCSDDGDWNLLEPRLAERFGGPVTVAAGAVTSACGCLALFGIGQGTGYWALCLQLIAIGGGLALSVPPLTSAVLGSVEKSRSGVAAGVLNSARQTGSVLGVALFGSLIGPQSTFVFGLRAALIISAALLMSVVAALLFVRR